MAKRPLTHPALTSSFEANASARTAALSPDGERDTEGARPSPLAAVHDPHGFARRPGQLALLEHGGLRAQVEKLFEGAAPPGQRGRGEALPGLDAEGEPVPAAGHPAE